MPSPPLINVADFLPAYPAGAAASLRSASQESDSHITSYGMSAFTSRTAYPESTVIDVGDSLQRVHLLVWLGDGVEIAAAGRSIRVPKRSLVMGFAPGQPMRTRFGGQNDHVGLLLPADQLQRLGGAQAERFMAFIRRHGSLSTGAGSATVLKAAHELDAVLRNGASSALLREAKSLELLALMLDACDIDTTVPMPAGRQMAALRQARDMLLADLARAPSIEGLARACGLNTFQLKQGFKQVFGISVHGCYQQARMQHAWELIESGHCNATQAGREVGYINASHFGAAFRKVFGVLPSELKRRAMSSVSLGGDATALSATGKA